MRVTSDLSTARWRKSSYSGGQQGAECVEVRDDLPGAVPVRDSKDVAGPVLMLSSAAWRPFVQGVRDGSL
ncbi:DUF397 domain-containing protein [Streptomyces naganishii]|uniref:DUF397 domain-containing protein n=1 Tax=Streptomyces naganishii JCM 4654 TaxID=1306179 RepID=A0A918Y8E8_9ACTN|nr:DUF397 domain-containing protein [Streptomyces naganishii]GHD93498.1 hypothetical protein GCM10010508_50610 [Streptomyces naganishii JCM 4654]